MTTRELRSQLETLQKTVRAERELPMAPPSAELLALLEQVDVLKARRDELKARVQTLRDELVAVKRDTNDGHARLSSARSEVAAREQLMSPEEGPRPFIIKLAIAIATGAGLISFAAGRCH